MEFDFHKSYLIITRCFFKLGVDPVWIIDNKRITQEEYDGLKAKYYKKR